MDKNRLEMYLKSGDLFVGRQAEITKVLDFFRNKSSKSISIVNVTGPGGIGKTKFITKVTNELIKENFFVTEIIDFYDTKNQTELGFVTNLAKAFKSDSYEDYFAALSDYQSATSEEKRGMYSRAIDSFYTCYKNYAEKQLVGIVFDTFDEKFAKSSFAEHFVGHHLDRLLEQNARILVAGRQKIEHSRLEGKINHLELEPFNLADTKELLQKRFEILNLTYEVDDHSLVEIIEKSQGKPIVINLAIDWIIENGGNTKALAFNKAEFVRSLVTWIRTLSSPEDSAILYMAVLYRRFDQELLEKTLHLRKGEGKDVFDNLSRFSFVKYKPESKICALHDEMRDYVNQYIGLAPSSVKELWNYAIKYYREKIRRTEDVQERNSLVAEWIFHQYLLDPEKGFKDFQKQFEKALANDSLDLCRALLEELLNLNTTQYQSYLLSLFQAELLLAEYRPKEAYNLLNELQSLLSSDKKLVERVLLNMGRALALQGEMVKGSELVSAARDVAIELRDFTFQKKAASILGDIYYWKGQYVYAIPYLEEVLRLSKRSKDKKAIIESMGVLGNVRRRQGLHKQALDYCTNALSLAKDAGNEILIAHAIRNMANIKRDMLEFDEAGTLYNKALEIFRRRADKLAIARTLSEYAWACFAAGLNQKAKDLTVEQFKLGEAVANESIGYKEKYRFNSELATTYHTLFEITYRLKGKDEAYTIIQKVYDLAKKYYDGYMLMDSLHHLAFLDYELGKSEDLIKSRANEMNELSTQGYSFPLFQGRVNVLLGHLSFDRGDHDSALAYYKTGYKMIAELGGTATGFPQQELFTRELKPTRDRLSKLDDETRKDIAQSFSNWWSAEGLDKEYPQIMDL